MLCVLSIRRDSSSFLSHTNMRLVDSHSLFSDWFHRSFEFPFMLLFFWRVPKHAVEQEITLDLHGCPCRVSVHPRAVSTLDVKLVLLFVLNSRGAVFKCLQGDAKASELVFLAEKLTSVPAIEVSKNSHSFSSRAPLHESDIVVWL